MALALVLVLGLWAPRLSGPKGHWASDSHVALQSPDLLGQLVIRSPSRALVPTAPIPSTGSQCLFLPEARSWWHGVETKAGPSS